MSIPAAKMWVMVGERGACIKLAGRANFSSSVDFRALLSGLREKGCPRFVLDLSECMLMDSTFLGVLAGFGLQMRSASPNADKRAIELLNPNPRVLELLESLGVLHLFSVTSGAVAGTPPGGSLHAPCDATKEEATRTSLEAHQTLMEVNPENVAKFKDVAAFLAEDLRKLKGTP